MFKILLDSPNLGELEKKYLNDAVDSGFVSTYGPYVTDFENRIAELLHVPCTVGLQSGTAALHIALYECGIGPGDEVIIPAITFAATAHAVLYVGATPVIVDVESDTWCISPSATESAITSQTKAVIPVHLYGNPCDMGRMTQIAQANNFFIIEDAAESLGSKYQGQYTGTLGDLGCLSFNGNKTITSASGGMIALKDPKRAEHIRYLINQSNPGYGFDNHGEIGYNYRLTNLSAAMGLAQVERVHSFLNKKKDFFQIYKKHLSGMPDVFFQAEYPGAENSYWLTAILLPFHQDVDRVIHQLKDKNIPARRFFNPLNTFKFMSGFCQGTLKNANDIYARGICLPSSTLNEAEGIEHVCDVLKELIT